MVMEKKKVEEGDVSREEEKGRVQETKSAINK